MKDNQKGELSRKISKSFKCLSSFLNLFFIFIQPVGKLSISRLIMPKTKTIFTSNEIQFLNFEGRIFSGFCIVLAESWEKFNWIYVQRVFSIASHSPRLSSPGDWYLFIFFYHPLVVIIIILFFSFFFSFFLLLSCSTRQLNSRSLCNHTHTDVGQRERHISLRRHFFDDPVIYPYFLESTREQVLRHISKCAL